MTYVIICGGRNFRRKKVVKDVLEALLEEGTIVVHGDAQGADKLAAKVAEEIGFETIAVPAQWDTLGKSAGPIRNAKMLEDYPIEYVIAFPGGRGTQDMCNRALRAGLPVETVRINPNDDDDVSIETFVPKQIAVEEE